MLESFCAAEAAVSVEKGEEVSVTKDPTFVCIELPDTRSVFVYNGANR